MSDLSIRAQAILAVYWGLRPAMTLTLQNRSIRLTAENAAAMAELIAAGIIREEKADDGYPESRTYRMTKAGSKTDFRRSLAWMEEHGRFSLTEPVK